MKKIYKAKVVTWNSGKWGKKEVRISKIKVKRFNNGNIKHTDFVEMKVYDVIQKGYCPRCANSSDKIESLFINGKEVSLNSNPKGE